MVIKLKRDCSFTIVDHLDRHGDPVERDEDFEAGQEIDGDLVDDEGAYINFQFCDGSMVYGLKKELYEVIEED